MKRFLVMMLYSWGLGDTLAEADANARREGNHGRRKVHRIVWTFDPVKTPVAYVDDYGSLCWKGEHPTRIEAECGKFGPVRTLKSGKVTGVSS